MSGGVKRKYCRTLLPDQSFKGPETSFFFLFPSGSSVSQWGPDRAEKYRSTESSNEKQMLETSVETILNAPTAICFSTLNTPGAQEYIGIRNIIRIYYNNSLMETMETNVMETNNTSAFKSNLTK